MTQFEVTVDENLLPALFGQGDGLKVLMEQVLNQVLAAQVTHALQAEPSERTADRTGYRNGLRERRLQTRIGTLTLSVPRTRSGEFSSELWERYQRSEQAFVLALCEMVLQGVSTRKVESVTQELCGAEFSKSTVSALCSRLDPLVSAWNKRPLGSFPFVLVDALVVKVREQGQVKPCALMIASGIDEEGHRQLLGFALGDRESESSWREFFLTLRDRGLTGVDLLVSDSHSGLVKAAQSCFVTACWQRCQVHFLRNLADACPKAHWEAMLASAKQVLYALDSTTARQRLRETSQAFNGTCPKAVALLETAFDDITAVLMLPNKYHRLLRTTNSMERTNEEVRRRERVIRIFPNRQSCERLLGALLMEFDEQMSCGKAYVGMQEYLAWRAARSAVQLLEQRVSAEPAPAAHNAKGGKAVTNGHASTPAASEAAFSA